MDHRDELIERVADTLKAPVPADPSMMAKRVMAEIDGLPVPGRPGLVDWLRRRHTFRLSPLGGLALAAGVAALVLAGSRVLAPGPATNGSGRASGAAEGSIVQFVLVAPGAGSVALVGDFNDWSRTATPLAQDVGDGVWSISIPLDPGRYTYSFLIDGSEWLGDPRAVPVVGDEFGRPSSVVTVEEL